MNYSKGIRLIGVRQNNLKGIDVFIPHNTLTVITGVSGSGKSSLAYDVIYAEGQRRYLESMSSYIRQFTAKLERPNIDSIEGLTPTVSIDKGDFSNNPRSTVGTVTEIYDLLRILYAVAGTPYCPNCGIPIEPLSLDEMVEKVKGAFYGKKLKVLAPIVRRKKGDYRNLFIALARRGYAKVRVDGIDYWLDEEIKLDKHKWHDIDVIVDSLTLKGENLARLSHAIQLAIELANDRVLIEVDNEEQMLLSARHSCPMCGFSYPEITWRLFSFNTPLGACPTCYGIGYAFTFPRELVLDPTRSILEGGIKPLGKPNYYVPGLAEFWYKLRATGIRLDVKVGQLRDDELNLLFEGDGDFEGLNSFLLKLMMKLNEISARIARYARLDICPTCNGYRLNRTALSVYLHWEDISVNIGQLASLPVRQVLERMRRWKPPSKVASAVSKLVSSIIRRLEFMTKVGLGYLNLLRPVSTLSGGELRRIKLARQLGAGLAGITYVLDEPTIGLHPQDISELISTLRELVTQGNTLIVVEHDLELIKASDYMIELGPGGGAKGGYLVDSGPTEEVLARGKAITAKYISGELRLEHRVPDVKFNRWLTFTDLKRNNLKSISVRIPMPGLVVIAGVSGSGKSSLLEELYERVLSEGRYKVKLIDQSPVGNTPRSTVATYTGIFDYIRKIYASLPESRKWGYKPSRFSYNVPGGRCEACKGEGYMKLDMGFLPTAYIRCETCRGKRYNRDTLRVRYKGLSISDVLELTVDDALELFSEHEALVRRLELLSGIGLGYLKLGQITPTLSGGEAQRIKIVSELTARKLDMNIYMFDEPTTGLHVDDVRKLLAIFHELVRKGALVIVIEHHLDIIASANWVIELGPGAADEGGQVLYQGPPESLIELNTPTGKWLRKMWRTSGLKGNISEEYRECVLS